MVVNSDALEWREISFAFKTTVVIVHEHMDTTYFLSLIYCDSRLW